MRVFFSIFMNDRKDVWNLIENIVYKSKVSRKPVLNCKYDFVQIN